MTKHRILWEGKAIVKSEQLVSNKYKAILSKFWSMGKPFPIDTFKTAFMTRVIYDNITLRQSTSEHLWYMFSIIEILALKVLLSLYNTTRCWILFILIKEKNTIWKLIFKLRSQVSINFDIWTFNTNLSFWGIVVHFLRRDLINFIFYYLAY